MGTNHQHLIENNSVQLGKWNHIGNDFINKKLIKINMYLKY